MYDKRMGVDMIFIFLLALILFGPKRLPEIAREVGKFMAEFKRASNDFKYQLQSEIDKASANAAPSSQPGSQPGSQAGSTAAPTLLPPAASPADSPAGSEKESEHERLMRTARMAFEAQNFTLRPPEPPPVASTALQPPEQQKEETLAPQSEQPSDVQPSLPFVPADPGAHPSEPTEGLPGTPESHPASPVEAARPSADPAHEAGDSALQNS